MKTFSIAKIVPLLVFFSLFVPEAYSATCRIETSRFDGMSIGEINSRVSMSIETSQGAFPCEWQSLTINQHSSWVCGFKNFITSHPHLGSVVLGEKIVLAKNGYWFFLTSIASNCSASESSDAINTTYEVYHQLPNSGWAPIKKSRIKVKQQFLL